MIRKNLGDKGIFAHNIHVPSYAEDSMKQALQQLAAELGFAGCRVAKASAAPHGCVFLDWLKSGYHAGMTWLGRNPERRCDPLQVFPRCRAIVLLAYPYDAHKTRPPGEGAICLYAQGQDYHPVLEEKMERLSTFLGEYGGTQRCYVDYGPVLERDFAVSAGLGWHGKSGMAVHEKTGSKFFIATILTDLALTPDTPVKNRCGRCERCVVQCPTGAIMPGGVVDANKCLSYWTIEHKGVTPESIRPLIGNRLYGCDTCVTVCPWNRRSFVDIDPRFVMPERLRLLPLRELMMLNDAELTDLVAQSPLKRLKRQGLLRNACIVAGNTGGMEYLPVLNRLREEGDLVWEHAQWAIAMIEKRQGKDID